MKKIFYVFSILALSVLCVSCASIPKKMKSGDSLVIGKMEAEIINYKTSGNDVNMNGHYLEGIEFVLRDVITGKETTVKTDKEGNFYIKGLVPHHTYGITSMAITKYINTGDGVKLTTTFGNPREFIAYDNIVVNLGATLFTLDGAEEITTWEVTSYYLVKQYFQELAAESEWINAEIIECRD